jgi:AraC family transcriptional regulator of adaptative response / DNA-3-methyladenine glycosylase II
MEMYHQALDARDARFDGIFYVGITSTGVYCRPVCPAKISYPNRRRFFTTAAAAEQAGYRPCLRCRPELAPGRAIMDAVPRLATVAAHRISAGALNGRNVPELARELGVSERHLRRALEREIGVSPIELAQTCRLLLAKRLLAETSLPITRIAFASGFQSLRRFNAIFKERYRMSPASLRRGVRDGERNRKGLSTETERDFVRLSLAYRAPLDWPALLGFLHRDAIPGVELVELGRYGRTVSLGGRAGAVIIENGAPEGTEVKPGETRSLTVAVSATLLPVLMPLLARIRQMLDLDAEPSVVDGGLVQGGLEALVREHPGLRIPSVLTGFEAALRVLLPRELVEPVANSGTPLESGVPGLSRLLPDTPMVAKGGSDRLMALGVPSVPAEQLAAVARLIADGSLRLEQGCDVVEARRILLGIDQVTEAQVTMIIMRALPWPDAFPASDPGLLRAAGVPTPLELEGMAERWRPWRAYAAHHLWLRDEVHSSTPGSGGNDQKAPFRLGESGGTSWATSQSSTIRSSSNRKMCTSA